MDFSKEAPTWSNEGTEPDETLQEKGFQAGDKPSANIFNWFWSRVSTLVGEITAGLTHITVNDDGGFEGGDTATAESGGAVGYKATSIGGGFAGGKSAEATNGGAALGNYSKTKSGGSVGSETESISGFAGGYDAHQNNLTVTQDGSEVTYGGGAAIGEGAVTTGSGGAIGSGAESTNGGGAVGRLAAATSGGAVGSEASETGGGGAIGYSAHSTTGGAIGYKADCNGVDCIQLGTGTNGNEKTLQVYDKQITDSSGNLVDVGALSDLSTTAKGTIVSAINELAKAASGTTTGTAELNKLYVNYDPDTSATDWNVVVSGGTKALAVGVSNTSADTADWADGHARFAKDASGLYISESESSVTDQTGSAVYLDSQTSVDITALDAIDITSGDNMNIEVNGSDGFTVTTTNKVVTNAGTGIYADAQSHVGIRGVDESYFVRGSVSAEDANTGASDYLETGTLKGLVLDDNETYLEDVDGTINIVGNKLYLTNKSSTASMELTSGANIDLNIPSGNTVKVVGGDFRGDNSNVIKAFSQLRLGLNAHKDSDLTDTTSNPVMISVGNGADSDNRSEAMTLYYDGTVEFGGNVYANGELLGSGTSEYAFTEITAEDIEALLA